MQKSMTPPFSIGASPGGNLLGTLKGLVRQNRLLLNAARSARSMLFGQRDWIARPLPGFAPLCIDQNRRGEFDEIAPTLWDEILNEFAQVSRVLGGVTTGLADPYYLGLAQNPLDDLVAGARDLHIVYTPGKVGSQTALATLNRHPSMKTPARFVHFLSSRGLRFVERLIERSTDRPRTAAIWRDSTFLGRWLRALLTVNRALRANGGPAAASVHKPFVITGIREPVALHLSYLFECWWMYADRPEDLTANFVHDRLADDAWHYHCNNWLANDLGETFDLDVYASPFPAQRGWEVYENDQARVMLIRQESLDALPEALGAMYGLGAHTFSVATTNTADSKAYAAHYESVKKNLRLSRRELDLIYAVPYVRHFYSPMEIERFKMRWEGGASLRRAA